MKVIFAMILALASFSVFAAEYKVQDIKCSTFDYYHSKKMCLIIIKDDFTQAGLLIDAKYVSAKVADETKLIGTRVSTNLNSLLMLTYEEEEYVRYVINYQAASYYTAGSKDIKFLDF